MSRDEMPIVSTGHPLYHEISEKTKCSDAETCESLNNFLDTGYGVPPTLGFTIQSTQDYVSTTIDFTGFGVREKSELIARLVSFVMNELNKVKNVQ